MESGRTRFAAIVTLVFVVLAGLGLARHEMWRDEMQAWLIPVGSSSLGDLIHNLRYEGHPALWHVLLWFLTRVTQRPEAMQALHLAISAAAVFLFVRNAPFSRPVRALFAFGYFPLYEYTVVSRNYGLGMLLLFAACGLFPTRRRSYLPLAATLALLANANPFAWLLALAFAGTLVLEAFWDPEVRQSVARRPVDAVTSLLLFGIGAAVALAQMIPPPDGQFATDWYLTLRVSRVFRVLTAVARGWLPIPNPVQPMAWNTNLLWHLKNGVTAAIALALIGCAIAALRRSRTALVLYLSGTAALLGFTYIKYAGYTRHHGAHFLLLLACLWIARAQKEDRPRGLLDVLLALLLAVHVVAGVWVYGQDLRHPFSGAKAAAGFLRGPQFREAMIVAYPDSQSTPVAGYLGRPFFYPQSRSLGTYVLWNRDRKIGLTFGELCKILRRQLRLHREGIVLVMNQPPPICGARLQPEELATFQDSLLPEERYGIFRLRLAPVGKPSAKVPAQ